MEFGNFRLLLACFILTLIVIIQFFYIQHNLIKFSKQINSQQILKALKMFSQKNETFIEFKYNLDYKKP